MQPSQRSVFIVVESAQRNTLQKHVKRNHMFHPKTFDDLCRAMQTRAEVRLFKTTSTGVKTIQGFIQSIQMESNDPEGHCWNVGLFDGIRTELVYVNTGQLAK
jgi:hypothetical protein